MRRSIKLFLYIIYCLCVFALNTSVSANGSNGRERIRENVQSNFKPFIIKEVTINGANAIPANLIEASINSFIGKKVSTKGLQNISDIVEGLYNNHGYPLVEAIIQEDKNFQRGNIIINITEGSINNFTITGVKVPNSIRDLIGKYCDHIIASKPLKKDILEKYLLLIDEIPGIEITSSFSSIDLNTGTATLAINIESLDRLEYWGGYNNNGSHSYETNQYALGAAINWFNLHGKTHFIGQKTVNNRAKVAGITHQQLFGSNGLGATLSAQRVVTNPTLRDSSEIVKGNSTSIAYKMVYPYKRSFDSSTSFYVGLEIANLRGSGTSDSQNYRDKLRPLKVGLRHEFLDDYYGSNIINTELHKGLHIFNASNGTDDTSRELGNSNFTKLYAKWLRYYYCNDNITILTRLSGQYSFSHLLISEEFNFGGNSVGRGYDSGAINGDHGLSVKIEPFYTVYSSSNLISAVDYYAFYDLGWVKSSKVRKIFDPSNNDQRFKASASSTGAGIRINSKLNLSGNFFIAWPLTFPNYKGNHNPKISFAIAFDA